nr:MAG TPA: hypothetical protein [Caudoviricetes sp.]
MCLNKRLSTNWKTSLKTLKSKKGFYSPCVKSPFFM